MSCLVFGVGVGVHIDFGIVGIIAVIVVVVVIGQLTSARNVSPQNNLMHPFLTIRHLSNHSLQFLTTGNYVHVKQNNMLHMEDYLQQKYKVYFFCKLCSIIQ